MEQSNAALDGLALAAGWVGALLLAPALAVAAECASLGGVARERFDTDRYVVAFRAIPVTIEVGRPFAIEAVICPKDASAAPAELRVDATMPEHRHGMNYRPTVVANGRGRFIAEGLLFHMPGRWELAFEFRDRGRTERITRDLRIE